MAHSEALWSLVKKNKMANTRVVLTGTIPDAAPAVARRRVPARSVERVYSTDDFGVGAGVAPLPPQPRQRIIGGTREADGEVYVEERPRGLFQSAPRAERRYYVVPRGGYEVPPPRYYYYNGR